MKTKIIIGIFFSLIGLTHGQQKVTWKDLSKVTFTDKFFPAYGDTYLQPEFSKSVKALNGKQISITGYFLNIDPDEDLYILSKGPMSACFFCGIGGPETAIEIHFKTKPSYRTDTVVTITGTLTLNATDVEHFNYILNDCTATTQ